MNYSIPFSHIAVNAVAGTYETVASLIVPDTTGVRARITGVEVYGAAGAPPDTQLEAKLVRIADLSAGTPGTKTAIAAADLPKKDSGSPDATVSAGVAYTVEPTTYESNQLWHAAFNSRGGVQKEWTEPKKMPTATSDQVIGLLVTSRDTNEPEVSGTIEIEVF